MQAEARAGHTIRMVRLSLRFGERLGSTLVLASALAVLLLATPVPSANARDVYVANGSSSVLVIDTQTNQVVGPPIAVGLGPFGVAVTPDGRWAYVVNIDLGQVKAVDTQTRQVIGSPITVGGGPYGIAITPDGARAYVATGSSVAVIDTQTNFVGPPIAVGAEAYGIAITPDGSRAYVANGGSSSVSVIDTQTNQVVGAPIAVGNKPRPIAITPDGSGAYVANADSDSVSVIDTQANQVVGAPIAVGEEPEAIAITPDGSRAYVANGKSDSVSVIDTQAKQVIGAPIAVGEEPKAIAITPDGRRMYVANHKSGDVSVIDTRTSQVVGLPITIGAAPEAIAITPDQAPVATFAVPSARPGVPVNFNAAASSDPDGAIGRYDWAFGDNQTAPNDGPTPSHIYSAPGTYQTTLTVTDNEGCSTTFVYTGQTASCNGSALATQTNPLTVAFPGVRVRCPKRAGRHGCRFKLQAVTKKHKGKVESAPAKAKAKAGKSVVVSVKPKRKFASKLASAKKILVRVTVTIKGAKRTSYRRLKVVR